MDPNENIKRQRELALDIARLADSENDVVRDDEFHSALEDMAVELSDYVRALDEWRRTGGFDPYLKQSPHSSERGLHEPPIPLGELKARSDEAVLDAVRAIAHESYYRGQAGRDGMDDHEIENALDEHGNAP